MIDVSMSENEIKDYLAQPILARIATVDDGRMPNIHPMWFLYEDSRMFMTTPKTAVKIRNIKNNNSVAIAVDTGEEGNITGVVFRGEAELVEEGARKIAHKILLKYIGDESDPMFKQLIEIPRSVIRLKPTKTYSWDYSKMKG